MQPRARSDQAGTGSNNQIRNAALVTGPNCPMPPTPSDLGGSGIGATSTACVPLRGAARVAGHTTGTVGRLVVCWLELGGIAQSWRHG
jgi:hypothetical protein